MTFPKASRHYAPEDVAVPGFLPDLPPIRQEVAEYYSSVHRCDETVGAILRALHESGLEDNTIVMFLSDNGMAFPFAKTNCWLNSTKTPWIVRWPGIIEAGRVDTQHMISSIDFMPTVLEVAGCGEVAGLDGGSFLPILEGEPQKGRDCVLTVFHETSAKRRYEMRCLQDRKYGYIFNAWADGKTVFRNESQSGRTFRAMQEAAKTDEDIAARVKHFLYRVPEEFYDFENDPDALCNLIGEEQFQDRISQMRKRLLAMMAEAEDPLAPRFKQFLETGALE